jgi:hypothetical protein
VSSTCKCWGGWRGRRTSWFVDGEEGAFGDVGEVWRWFHCSLAGEFADLRL